jgi:hypothetical protein
VLSCVVIELNDVSIAGDFAVLSSLSGGYKITIDRESLTKVGEGYDWASSVFGDPALRHLKGIMWFDLGNYESRRIILNPMFGRPTHDDIAGGAYALFGERGREHGRHIEDWLRAERELFSEEACSSASALTAVGLVNSVPSMSVGRHGSHQGLAERGLGVAGISRSLALAAAGGFPLTTLDGLEQRLLVGINLHGTPH